MEEEERGAARKTPASNSNFFILPLFPVRPRGGVPNKDRSIGENVAARQTRLGCVLCTFEIVDGKGERVSCGE